MGIKILNPEVVENLYRSHGEFACVCYDTDTKYAERVGEHCEETGHMSGSRCEYIKFLITDVDRGTAEQCLRHEIGARTPYNMIDNYTFADWSEVVKDVNPSSIVKNMASFRYIDKDGFDYEVPRTVKNCERAKIMYDNIMFEINDYRNKIKTALIANGVNEKQATQDANFILPRATTTDFVIGFTPEALIHFCHKRLCTRSQEFIQNIAREIKNEVKKYNEKFANELVPHCRHLLWCPEGKMSCGAYPTKDELKERIGAK